MGLKKSIVVVNEYTIKNSSGKGGSRGGSPGNYVTRYMARNGATETLTPVRAAEQEDYIQRYMARASACERVADIDDLRPEFHKIQKYGGVAFSKDSVSLSDEKLDFLSHDIQQEFDKGKTVMKTVISFDNEYLKQMKIVPEDFECENAGDYKGQIDQMKLRRGIQNGMDYMGRNFDNLEYVGVIQVDTRHVHCHLAMVDKGRGRIMPDGTQRGKLLPDDMMNIRRGIDMYLDDEKQIQHMSSNIDNDKRNTKCYVKRTAHKMMEENANAQFLLSCLPEDKRLWRASSNSKLMQKPNNIMRDYVRSIFAQPDSGYDAVRQDIYRYAQERCSKEDLSGKEFRKFVEQGEKRVENECINSVYKTLSGIQKSDLQVRTPMLDMMSVPPQSVGKDSSDFEEFGYKLRTYSSRLAYHKDKKKTVSEHLDDYNRAKDNNQVSDSSEAVQKYLQFERMYQEQCMCKYQHFIQFLPLGDEFEDELEELLKYKDSTRKLQEMFDDDEIRMKTKYDAEQYGLDIYNHEGGRFMTYAPDIIEEKLIDMKERLKEKDSKFADKLVDNGAEIDENGVLKKHIKHDFEDVKHLDMHHLGYDSPHDMTISKFYIDKFKAVADERKQLADDAEFYLTNTGQSEAVAELIDKQDIELMYSVAHEITSTGVISSQRNDTSERNKRSRTFRLDYSIDLHDDIRKTLQAQKNNESQNDDDYYGRKRIF